MDKYKKCLEIMEQLFGKDFIFYLATSNTDIPSLRVVDTYFYNGAFWVVTYSESKKAVEIMNNPNIAICKDLYSFKGKAFNEGHPLDEKNKKIRAKLIEAFKPWYFQHNNENDKNMCFVKFAPESGFFYKDGTGYKADFKNKEVECFPFESNIIGIE